MTVKEKNDYKEKMNQVAFLQNKIKELVKTIDELTVEKEKGRVRPLDIDYSILHCEYVTVLSLLELFVRGECSPSIIDIAKECIKNRIK